METDAREEARYASMMESLKEKDDSMHDAAYEEAENAICRRGDLLKRESDLIEAVMKKVENGTRDGYGNANRLALNLKRRLSRDGVNNDRVVSILDRIAAFPNANETARTYAVEAVFDIPHIYLSQRMIDYVATLPENKASKKQGTFENKTVDKAMDIAADGLGQKEGEPDSVGDKVFKSLRQSILDGKIDEGMVRRFMRNIRYKWGDNDLDFLKQIKNSTKLASDIREMARTYLEG